MFDTFYLKTLYRGMQRTILLIANHTKIGIKIPRTIVPKFFNTYIDE